jgi:hypothetical protein
MGSSEMPDSNELKLKSGRTLYVNCGIVGISPNLGTYGGYDDNLAAEDWSAEDQIELADLMIARWQAFKKQADKNSPRAKMEQYLKKKTDEVLPE